MQISEHLEKLIDSLSRFPGIGKKTAGRLAWHIVSSDKSFARQLAENISTAVEAFRPCSLSAICCRKAIRAPSALLTTGKTIVSA